MRAAFLPRKQNPACLRKADGVQAQEKHRKRLPAYDLAGLEALRAHVGFVGMAIFDDGDLLDIRADDAIRHTMRVADIATSRRMLATD